MRVRLIALLSGMLCVATSSLSAFAEEAAAYQWRHVAIGGGGFITGIDMDQRGLSVVARTDVYGAYIWDNTKWRQLVTAGGMPSESRVQHGMMGGVYEIAVSPSDPDVIYLASGGHVYRSGDRGRSFVRASQAAPFPIRFDANSEHRLYGPFLAIHPHNPNTIYLGTPHDGLLKSIDGGRTWREVTTVPRPLQEGGKGGPGHLIWISGQQNRVLVSSFGRGVFAASLEGGDAFTPTFSKGATSPVEVKSGTFGADGSFFAVENTRQRAWRFKAGAWEELTHAPGLGATRFASIAAAPQGGQLLVFDETGTPFSSADEGLSWRKIARTSEPGSGEPPWLKIVDKPYFAISVVRADPVRPAKFWIGAGTGVYVAQTAPADNKMVLVSQTRGIEELVANDVIHTPGQAPLFAAWDFGIHRKPDLDMFSSTYGPRPRVIISAQQLANSASDPKFFVTNASDTRPCCSEDGQSVLAGFSTDGGSTWKRFATLPQPPGTAPEDPWRMSYGTIAVSSGDPRNIVWAPSRNRSPFYTKDQGQTWQRVSLPGEQLPYTGSHEHYHYHRKTLAADAALSGVFYLYHSGDGVNAALRGLWRTANGGDTWEKIFIGEIAPTSRFSAKLRVVPKRAGHLFFTTGLDNGPDTRLRRSTDGGRTWQALDAVTHIDDIGFGKEMSVGSYPTIYVSGRVDGQYGIYRSVDEGVSWTRVVDFPMGTLDRVTVIEGDKDTFGKVYIGYQGSGWIYGEPAHCLPDGPLRECTSVNQTLPAE